MKIAGMGPLPDILPDRPVLIAGPTASGKSDLALAIAEAQGGVVVNADASQVYGCWRVITARPSPDEEARVPHALFGHVDWRRPYSAGDWLRDLAPLLGGDRRPIIVGGTGLYFHTLTNGMAEIPPTPPAIRAEADRLSLAQLCAGLDARTRAGLDPANRARVQRAWEVQQATGRGLADWQADTPAPLLARKDATALVLEIDKVALEARIAGRFDRMLAAGALEEVAAMRAHHDAALPAFRAIGVAELMAHLDGTISLDEARRRVVVSTRQFAKRQRTWFRSRMAAWQRIATGKT